MADTPREGSKQLEPRGGTSQDEEARMVGSGVKKKGNITTLLEGDTIKVLITHADDDDEQVLYQSADRAADLMLKAATTAKAASQTVQTYCQAGISTVKARDKVSASTEKNLTKELKSASKTAASSTATARTDASCSTTYSSVTSSSIFDKTTASSTKSANTTALCTTSAKTTALSTTTAKTAASSTTAASSMTIAKTAATSTSASGTVTKSINAAETALTITNTAETATTSTNTTGTAETGSTSAAKPFKTTPVITSVISDNTNTKTDHEKVVDNQTDKPTDVDSDQATAQSKAAAATKKAADVKSKAATDKKEKEATGDYSTVIDKDITHANDSIDTNLLKSSDDSHELSDSGESIMVSSLEDVYDENQLTITNKNQVNLI